MAESKPVQSGNKVYLCSAEEQKLRRLRRKERVYVKVSKTKDKSHKVEYTVKGKEILFLQRPNELPKKYLILSSEKPLENEEDSSNLRRSSRSQKCKSARELLGLSCSKSVSKSTNVLQKEEDLLSLLVEFTNKSETEEKEETKKVTNTLTTASSQPSNRCNIRTRSAKTSSATDDQPAESLKQRDVRNRSLSAAMKARDRMSTKPGVCGGEKSDEFSESPEPELQSTGSSSSPSKKTADISQLSENLLCKAPPGVNLNSNEPSEIISRKEQANSVLSNTVHGVADREQAIKRELYTEDISNVNERKSEVQQNRMVITEAQDTKASEPKLDSTDSSSSPLNKSAGISQSEPSGNVICEAPPSSSLSPSVSVIDTSTTSPPASVTYKNYAPPSSSLSPSVSVIDTSTTSPPASVTYKNYVPPSSSLSPPVSVIDTSTTSPPASVTYKNYAPPSSSLSPSVSVIETSTTSPPASVTYKNNVVIVNILQNLGQTNNPANPTEKKETPLQTGSEIKKNVAHTSNNCIIVRKTDSNDAVVAKYLPNPPTNKIVRTVPRIIRIKPGTMPFRVVKKSESLTVADSLKDGARVSLNIPASESEQFGVSVNTPASVSEQSKVPSTVVRLGGSSKNLRIKDILKPSIANTCTTGTVPENLVEKVVTESIGSTSLQNELKGLPPTKSDNNQAGTMSGVKNTAIWQVIQQDAEKNREQTSESLVSSGELVECGQETEILEQIIQERSEPRDSRMDQTPSTTLQHAHSHTPPIIKSRGGYRKQFTNADLMAESVSTGGKHKHMEQILIMPEFQQLIHNLKPTENMTAHVTVPGGSGFSESTRKPVMECKYCKKLIRNRHDFRRHIVTHPEVDFKPWKCPLCDYRALVKSTIRKHINVHSEVKPYVCLECGRGFNFKQKLHLHMKYHQDIREFFCPRCHLAFHEIKTLKNHLGSVHDVPNPTEFLRTVNYRVPEERHLDSTLKHDPENATLRPLKHTRKIKCAGRESYNPIGSSLPQEEHLIYYLNSPGSLSMSVDTNASSQKPGNLLFASHVSEPVEDIMSLPSVQASQTVTFGSAQPTMTIAAESKLCEHSVDIDERDSQTIGECLDHDSDILSGARFTGGVNPIVLSATNTSSADFSSIVSCDHLIAETRPLSQTGLHKGMIFTTASSMGEVDETPTFQLVDEGSGILSTAHSNDTTDGQATLIREDIGHANEMMVIESFAHESENLPSNQAVDSQAGFQELHDAEVLEPNKNSDFMLPDPGNEVLDEKTGELVLSRDGPNGDADVYEEFVSAACVKEEVVGGQTVQAVEIMPQSSAAESSNNCGTPPVGEEVTTHFLILDTSLQPTDVEKGEETLSPTSLSKRSKLLGTPKINAQTNRFKGGVLPIQHVPNNDDIKIEADLKTQGCPETEKVSAEKSTPSQPKVNCKKITDLQKMEPGVREYVIVVDDTDEPNSKKLVCKLCSENQDTKAAFRIYSKFLEHLFHEHPALKPFKCTECGFACRSKANLSSHRKTHVGVKKHVCNICGKGFLFSQKLKVHLRIHSNVRDHSCDLCNRAFNEKSDLNRHFRKVHMKEKKIPCRVCNKQYYDITDLKRHMDSHNEEKLFLCPYCNKYYQTRMSLSQHMKSHTCMFHCEICNKDFGSYSGFMAHKVMHDESTDGYWCSLCNKKIATKGSHKRHMKVCHSDSRPFHCTVCNKAFKTKKDFKSHELSHSCEKMYVCAVCKFSSSRVDSLKVHMRTHALVKPFQCGVCGKEYTQKAALDQHMIHHTEKHKCSICKKSYPSEFLLNQHMITVHVPMHLRQQVLSSGSMTVFLCEECHSVFVSQEDLSRHIMTSHATEFIPEDVVSGSVAKEPCMDSHVDVLQQPSEQVIMAEDIQVSEVVGEISQVECEVVTDDLQIESLVSISSPSSGQSTKMVSLVHPLETTPSAQHHIHNPSTACTMSSLHGPTTSQENYHGEYQTGDTTQATNIVSLVYPVENTTALHCHGTDKQENDRGRSTYSVEQNSGGLLSVARHSSTQGGEEASHEEYQSVDNEETVVVEQYSAQECSHPAGEEDVKVFEEETTGEVQMIDVTLVDPGNNTEDFQGAY